MRESALWGGNASCAASMPEQATFVSLSLSAYADMIHEQRPGCCLAAAAELLTQIWSVVAGGAYVQSGLHVDSLGETRAA